MEIDITVSNRQIDRRFNCGIRHTECKLSAADKSTGQRTTGHFRSSPQNIQDALPI